jgi:hypothetical protein
MNDINSKDKFEVAWGKPYDYCIARQFRHKRL